MVTWPASPQIPTAPGRSRQPGRPPQRGVRASHARQFRFRRLALVQSPRRVPPDDGPRPPPTPLRRALFRTVTRAVARGKPRGSTLVDGLGVQGQLDADRGALTGRTVQREPTETTRCWMPSCRFRAIRRRVSSLAVTIRARDAIRLFRAWTLEIELATRWVKSVRRVSASGGRTSAASTTITPHGAPRSSRAGSRSRPHASGRHRPGASRVPGSFLQRPR